MKQEENYLKKELYQLIKSDESIFDFLQESALDGLWYWDLVNPDQEWMNPKFWTTLGYDPNKMPHRSDAWQNIIDQDDLKVAIQNVEKHFQDPTHPYDQVVRYQHQDGHTVWIRCRGLAIRNDEGEPVRMLGAHTDVTALKLKEFEQEITINRLKSIISSSGGLVFIVKEDLKIAEFYVKSQKDLLIAPEEFIGKKMSEVEFPEEALSIIENTVKEAFKLGTSKESEYHLSMPMGDEYFLITVNVIFDKVNGGHEAVCVIRDITQQKRTHQEIASSKAELDLFFNNALYGAFFMMLEEPIHWNDQTQKEEALDYVMDHQHVTKVNQAMLDQYGAEKSAFIGLTPRGFFPDDIEYAKELWRKLFDQGVMLIETREQKFDGCEMLIEGHYTCLYDKWGRITGHFGIQQEVTEKVKTFQKLADSEARNKSYVDTAPYGVFVTDQEGKYVEVNKAAENLTGYSRKELLQMSIPELWADKKNAKELGKLKKMFAIGDLKEEIHFRKKDGEERLMSITAFRLSHNRHLSFVSDIHDQKTAERRIKESRAKYRMLSDLTMEGILIHEQGKAIEYNHAFANIFGYGEKELIGKKVITKLVHPEDLPLVKNILKEKKSKPFIIRGVKKDGTIFPIEVEGETIQYDGKLVRVSAIRDFTEKVKARETLEKSQKQLEKLTNNVPGIVFELLAYPNGKLDFLFVSKHINDLGIEKAQQIKGNPAVIFDDIHPDDLLQFQQALQKSWEDLSLWEVEFRKIRKTENGDKTIWYKGIAQPEYTTDGNLLLSGIVQDITTNKEMHETIKAEKQRLNNIIEGTRAGTWEWNLQTGETIFNENWAKIIGYRLKELQPTSIETWMKYAHPEDLKKSDQLLQECFNGKADYYESECRMKHKNGSWIWVLDRGKVTEWTEDGKPLKMAGTHQEITERKHAESALFDSQKQLLKLTENVPGSIFQVEKSGDEEFSLKFLSKNEGLDDKGLAQLFKSPQQYYESVHTDDREKLTAAFYDSAETLTDIYIEYRTIHDDTLIWNKVTAKPERKEGGNIVWYGIRQDITEKKKAEEELEEAKTLAEAASVAKSDFLANMSHEIRTPLNGVIGFTDLLLKTKLDATQDQYMQTVHQSANALLETINDILDFSKIEAGKLELVEEKTDLMDLSGKITDLIKYQAHKKNLEILLNIRQGIPRFIWIDEIRLKQILVNLLGNAVKFTDQGEIELKIDLLEQVTDGEAIFRFAVRDTGIGIGERNQKKIFEAFSQEDASTTRKFGGTGLGLSISNKLLAMMGSELQLESELGKGSLFYFDLRLKSADGESIGWNCSQTRHYYHNILIVDDNANNCKIIEEMFRARNINTESANNGLEALHKIANGNKFDVVLMDYHMPYMDGLETIRKIRHELNLDAKEQPVVLFHSSSNDEELINACKSLGVTQFLVKPVTMTRLCQCLMKLQEVNLEQIQEETQTQQKRTFTRKSKILIAEDNEINMLLAKTIIERVVPSAIILQVDNGKDAVKICLQEKPDLVFMDIQMPEMNGYDATREIRNRLGQHLPIIALTAGTVKGEADRCKEAGMDDYLAKPIVQEQIYQAAKKWLNQDHADISKEALNDISDQSQHFDLQKLQAKVKNDHHLLNNIILKTNSFLDQVMKNLQESYNQGKYDDFREFVHNLKGTSGSVCLIQLNELTTQLLAYCDQGKTAELPKYLMKISNEIQLIKQVITDMEIEA